MITNSIAIRLTHSEPRSCQKIFHINPFFLVPLPPLREREPTQKTYIGARTVILHPKQKYDHHKIYKTGKGYIIPWGR